MLSYFHLPLLTLHNANTTICLSTAREIKTCLLFRRRKIYFRQVPCGHVRSQQFNKYFPSLKKFSNLVCRVFHFLRAFSTENFFSKHSRKVYYSLNIPHPEFFTIIARKREKKKALRILISVHDD